MTTVYHVTTPQAAAAILASGFEDRSAWYFRDRGHVRGTFVCGHPATALPGAPGTSGGAVLEIDVPEAELSPYLIPGQNPEPMWIVPAAVLNRHGVSLAAGHERA